MVFSVIALNPVVDELEQLGTKEKFWFSDPDNSGQRNLFKYSRAGTGEHWSEKCAAEFCHLLEIPHAKYNIAEHEGRLGVISYNIIPSDDFRMVMGNEVLHSSTSGYPKPLREGEKLVSVREHTIPRVLGCLDKESILPPPTEYNLYKLNAADVFCGYLMLDALISNQDRHHENWAIMLNNSTGEQFLCPTYDHAASLGREMLDTERKERLTTKDQNRQIPCFVRKARSELFKIKNESKTDKKQKPLTTVEAFQFAVEKRELARNHWLGKLKNLTEETIISVFQEVPERYISEIARTFAIEMVMENRRRLLE